MDALSLSHLTYRFADATLTVNFHRLDHPPFPCKTTITVWLMGVKLGGCVKFW